LTTEPKYRHIFNSDQCGRKGARCEIVRGKGFLVQIRFEDGFTLVVNRQTVKRPKPGQMKRLGPKTGK